MRTWNVNPLLFEPQPPSVSDAYLAAHHNLWIVTASLVIATLASYVALDLSRRVRSADGAIHPMWWAVGSLALGTGIWSMHFVGMLGFSLPIPIGFTGFTTFISWMAAVVASSVALWVASKADYSVRRVLASSLVMGAGICVTSRTGITAVILLFIRFGFIRD